MQTDHCAHKKATLSVYQTESVASTLEINLYTHFDNPSIPDGGW